MKAVCMSNNIIKFPQKNIQNPQILSGGNSKEQVFKNEQLRVSVQLIINPKDNDISEIPLIKQIRFFISQVERPNGVKLTKAGYLPTNYSQRAVRSKNFKGLCY
jgi:hypothetical protein